MRWWPGRGTGWRCDALRLQSAPIVRLYFADFLIGTEERVLGHIGAVPARFWMPAQRLGQGANVMWAGPATHPQVIDAHRIGFPPEVGNFRTRAYEGIEPGGKGPRVAAAGIGKRHE